MCELGREYILDELDDIDSQLEIKGIPKLGAMEIAIRAAQARVTKLMKEIVAGEEL